MVYELLSRIQALDLVDDVAWLKEVSGIDFSADLHRMNPDARAASARFEAELTAIPAGAGEQLSEYVRKRTGFAAGTMEEALRHPLLLNKFFGQPFEIFRPRFLGRSRIVF